MINMEYCLVNYCVSGYQIAILLILELLFWGGVAFLGYKKYKTAKIKNNKK